jgi:hypothetical protein
LKVRSNFLLCILGGFAATLFELFAGSAWAWFVVRPILFAAKCGSGGVAVSGIEICCGPFPPIGGDCRDAGGDELGRFFHNAVFFVGCYAEKRLAVFVAAQRQDWDQQLAIALAREQPVPGIRAQHDGMCLGVHEGLSRVAGRIMARREDGIRPQDGAIHTIN